MMHRCCTVSVETQISSPVIPSTNKAEAPKTAEVFPRLVLMPMLV